MYCQVTYIYIYIYIYIYMCVCDVTKLYIFTQFPCHRQDMIQDLFLSRV